MSCGLLQKLEKLLTMWISTERRHFINISLLFLLFFNPFLGSPAVETEFFGADINRVKETPKYLRICHKNDKKLDECIKSSLDKFIESASSNFRDLNLPNLDTIEIPLLKFKLGSGNVSLHVSFKDFRISGFKNFKVTNVKSNLADSKFEISTENPQFSMTAQFLAEGGVYTFPIAGQGEFYLNLTDVSSVLIFHLGRTKILPGLSFLTAEKCLVDLLSSEINAHFGEFIDGNNKIGAAFNAFFNNNAHEIFTLIKPNISNSLSNIFCSIANEILSRHPDDVLFPD